MSKYISVLVVVLLFFSSCRPEPHNTKTTLDSIVDSQSFDFEIQLQGCFAGSTNHFTLEQHETGYLLTCKETHKTIVLSQKNRDDFKALLSSLITSKEAKVYSSTGYFRLRAYNFFNAVEYDKSEEWLEFNKILKFSSIIPKP